MFRNKSVDVHQFAMVPRADIPRSSFTIETAHKSTFDAGFLVPIFVDEVLPGDSYRLQMTAFARMSTPLFPIMDNLYLNSFFFFVPCRLVWSNWRKFMGEQASPGDSISFVIPQVVSGAGGFVVGTIYDYMGLPTVGQVGGGNTVSVNALPLRAYNLIWNEWFRDENLCVPVAQNVGDGPDNILDFNLKFRGKRHDYFTSCLPWPQKGATPISYLASVTAPVKSDGTAISMKGVPDGAVTSVLRGAGAGSALTLSGAGTAGGVNWGASGATTTGLYADLGAATNATINQLRQSFQIQKLLERDARGGTRYTELVRAHFGVESPDARLQRPEYLGGGSSPINVQPIAQTSASGLTGGTTKLGELSAMATIMAGGHGFTQSFTEHGYILGLVCVNADLTYQQGLRKMWSRSTRYDFYFPAFAMLGEQAVLNKEIYCRGDANDNLVFGYQERWAEYRYQPSMITGLFRSTSAGTIDPWHVAEKFTALPTLNETFISDTTNSRLSRNLAVGASANGQQFIFDSVITKRVARPMPLYSVPGLIDHF